MHEEDLDLDDDTGMDASSIQHKRRSAIQVRRDSVISGWSVGQTMTLDIAIFQVTLDFEDDADVREVTLQFLTLFQGFNSTSYLPCSP